MSIFSVSDIWGRIKGGWKTLGPGSPTGPGAFSIGDHETYGSVGEDAAMRVTAFHAGVRLRAETIGSLPLHIRDEKKNVVRDHDLYDILHNSPNSMMTSDEFFKQAVANIDLHGNSLSIVERRVRDKSVISLEPVSPATQMELREERGGSPYYLIGGEKFAVENVLHLKGFSTRGHWGLPKLELGRHVLYAQITANQFAMRAFKQGTKVGGFIGVKDNGNNLTTDQVKELTKRLDAAATPEQAGRWVTLFKGIEPIGGAQFTVKPADAELLMSRYFGIEELCRLINVPPQLIGHSDKASSWASSLENINLHFLMYSLQPTYVGIEKRIVKTLLSSSDRRLGLMPKFSIGGLLRADMKTQQAMFASALQNGYYSIDEVRDMLDRGPVEGGDKHRVQLNMQAVTEAGKEETQ